MNYTDKGLSFGKLYTILTFLIIINFFLTSNPYAALHSGAILTRGVESTYFIVPAYVIIITMLFVLMKYQQNIITDFKLLLGFILMFITALTTSTVLTEANTYLYNFLSFLLCYSLAFLMNKSKEWESKKVKKFLLYLNFIFLDIS